MGRRTVLTLAGLALALAGYILVFERHAQTTDEARRAAQKVVRGLQRERVRRIVLRRKAGEVVLERRPGDEGWALRAPLAAGADRGAVDGILSGVEFLEHKRRLGPAEAATPARFGLAPPRVVVRLEGDAPIELRVGGPAAGGALYVATGDGAVYVVDRSFADAVDKGIDELRDRTALVFTESKLRRIALGPVELLKERGRWLVGGAGRARAAEARVGQLVTKLQELRATRFVAEGTEGLERHGLASPARTVVIDDGTEQTLLVGGPCPGAPAEAGELVAARKGREPGIFCVKQADADGLQAEPAALREPRLLPVGAEEARTVTVVAAGAELALERKEGQWRVVRPSGQAADEGAVRKWLEDLAAYRALPDAGAGPPPGDLGKKGATVTVVTQAGVTEQVRLGPVAPGGRRWAQRGAEPPILVHQEAAALFDPSPLRVRERKVLGFERWDVKALVARDADGTEEELRKGTGESWVLARPAALDADADRVDKLLARLSDLQAVRWVAARAEPRHGLDRPGRRLQVTTEPAAWAKEEDKKKGPATYVVEVGADDPQGGCFGRLAGGDGAVFLLEAAGCGELRAHLATRRLLTLDEEKLVGFELRRGAQAPVGLEKRGPGWYRTAGPELAKGRVDDLLAVLRELTALEVVGYGPARAGARPRAEVTVRTEGAKDQVIQLGAAARSGGGEAAVRARVGDRPVEYLVPEALLGRLEKLELTE